MNYRLDKYAATIWDASRADEGTISATGARHVALAVMAVADAELDKLRAEVKKWEDRYPCDAGCYDAPEESCSRHGRTPAELWDMVLGAAADAHGARGRAEDAEAKVARVEALIDCASIGCPCDGDRAAITTDELRAALEDHP